MKIEKISDTKIKIELSEKEITRWSRVANTRIPDYNAMMVDLISAAEKETGVSFRNCRIVVEASQQDDKYVVFVSREGGRAQIRREAPRPPAQSPRIVAEFDELEAVSMFDRHHPFYATMLRGANSLYAYNGRYYLDITVPERFSGYTKALRGHLSDFSSSAGGTVIPYMLSEHGRCLLPNNALLLLRKMN